MKKVDFYNFFLHYIKMAETTYYQRTRETILNRGKDYYKNNKEVLREKAKDKYRVLSEEERYIKKEYGRYSYKNISEEKKQRLVPKKLS